MIKRIEDIPEKEWTELMSKSDTASWFQSTQAFEFFVSIPHVVNHFGYGVYRDNELKGICLGIVTVENNPLKQFFTRRAIINGGPLLAEDITSEEVTALMQSVRKALENLPWQQRPIYIETRNFNDYSRYKDAFSASGFAYRQHLNFQVPTLTVEQIKQQMDIGRQRNIRSTIKAGATIVEVPSAEQIRTFYLILRDLYRRKVRTPLFPLSFFENLRNQSDSVFLLIEYKGRIIGGTACVIVRDRCLYEWYVCGEDGMHEGVYASSFATYAGLQYAAENNLQVFDMMGAGVPDEPNGIRDFKARFGGKLVEHGRFLSIIHPFLYHFGVWGVKMLRFAK